MKNPLFIILLACFSSLAAQELLSKQDRALEADRLMSNYQFSQALGILSFPEDSMAVDILQRRGHCLFRMGNYGSAIRQFEKIVALDSVNRNALFQQGQLYARNNQFADAYAC